MTWQQLIVAIIITVGMPIEAGDAVENTPPVTAEGHGWLASQIKPAAGLSARFTQERKISALSRPLRSSGMITIENDGNILWQQDMPYTTTTRFTDTGIIERDDQGQETLTTNPLMAALGRAFTGLFDGNTQALEIYFTLIVTRNDDNSWKISLVPIDATLAKAIKRIDVFGTDVITRIDIFEATDGNSSHIRFTDHQWTSSP